MIYLDNAATTKIDPEVLDEMMPFLTEEYGNAGSIHPVGSRAKKAVDTARERTAKLFGCKPDQILFTSGGTEANNMVFWGIRDYLLEIGKTRLVSSAVEHESVLKTIEKMCIKRDFDKCFVGVTNDGYVNMRELDKAVDENTGLVSVMYVNNETGNENDVKSIGGICKRKDALFFTDCVQAAGTNEINVESFGCDFASVSGHKIHAPKGTGALFVKNVNIFSSMICGGNAQEFGFRGGTENVAGIVGLGKACELAFENQKQDSIYTSILKQTFYSNLYGYMNHNNMNEFLHVNGDVVIKPGKILSLTLDGVDAETLVLYLGNKGLCISAGSACTSHESKPSHVLTAMGVSNEDARNTVRISFSKTNTKEEIEEAARIVSEAYKELRYGIYL